MLEQWNVVESQAVVWIQEHLRVPALTPFVQWFTNLGNAGLIAIFVCALLLCIRAYRRSGKIATLALVINFLLTNVCVKNLVNRTRPFVVNDTVHLITRVPGDASFPSGHTAATMAVACAVYLTCPKKVGIPAMIFAVAMGLSRLYVGVHYPTDVLGGAIVGILSALLAKTLYEKLAQRLAK